MQQWNIALDVQNVVSHDTKIEAMRKTHIMYDSKLASSRDMTTDRANKNMRKLLIEQP